MSKKLKALLLTTLAIFATLVFLCLCLVFPVLFTLLVGGLMLYVLFETVMLVYSEILDFLDD